MAIRTPNNPCPGFIQHHLSILLAALDAINAIIDAFSEETSPAVINIRIHFLLENSHLSVLDEQVQE